MIRQSLMQRVRRALAPMGAGLLCLFLAWATGAMIRADRATARATAAASALAFLHDLHAGLARLQGTTRSQGLPSGGIELNQAPVPDARLAETAVRAYFRLDPAALSVLDGAAALRCRAMETTRATLRQGADRPGGSPGTAAGPPAPGLVEARRDLATASEQIARLEELCVSDLGTAAMAAGRCRFALAASLGATAALLFLMLYNERVRRHQRRGARLAEDMMEAYSRRLEAMNVELEQVNLLKSQFLANTSHELLTPLNGVMGSLEVVRSRACSSPEDEREFLDQAYHSAERLFALIRDLLDLCRLEEGNLALGRRSLEFGAILERELANHRSALAARGLVLLVTPPAGGWPRVAGDSERITQVLHHLVANALKFTERGSLRVTGRIEEQPPSLLRIEVADTGVGIEPGKLGQVFDLFSQADGSNPRRFGGTGLGLTLSRHLVQGMGGQIGIESDGPGCGTRVWFTLPLATGETRVSSRSQDDQSRAA